MLMMIIFRVLQLGIYKKIDANDEGDDNDADDDAAADDDDERDGDRPIYFPGAATWDQ